MLTIYIDFKSPASYLALEPTLALIAETGVETKWLPFSSRPFSVPDKKPDETVGDRHRRVRATSQRDIHLHYAKVQGREMQFAESPFGSDAALAVFAGLNADPLRFIKAAFDAYWIAQVDLDDDSVVLKLAEGAGFGRSPQDPEKLDDIRNNALDRKIFDCPSFLIKEQLFIGREHLPWIRSIIAGHVE